MVTPTEPHPGLHAQLLPASVGGIGAETGVRTHLTAGLAPRLTLSASFESQDPA